MSMPWDAVSPKEMSRVSSTDANNHHWDSFWGMPPLKQAMWMVEMREYVESLEDQIKQLKEQL